MKKVFFLICFVTFASLYAQRIAYVDSERALKQLAQYEVANLQLEKVVDLWNKEFDDKEYEIKQMQSELDEEKILLTEDQIAEKQEEIDDLRKKMFDLKRLRFGENGDYFRQRIAMVKPLQDLVYNAIKTVSEEKGYGFVFDKSKDSDLLYTNPKWDITDLVIEKLKN